MVEKKSKIQNELYGIKIQTQNDAHHKIKNSKKDRIAKFSRLNVETQKMYATLNHLKKSGLEEIMRQLDLNISHLKKQENIVY